MRPSQRQSDQIRTVSLTRNFTRHAEGSVLIEMGDTRVLCTASGRAYFAFCPDTEMEQLLRVLSASADAEQVRLARDDRLVQRMVARTRKDGYAVNDGDWKQEPHVGAIAVPLRAPDKVLGCINVVYLRRAIPAQEAVAKFRRHAQALVRFYW